LTSKQTAEQQKENSIKKSKKPTCRSDYSSAQILTHNIPLLSMYALGIIILSFIHILMGLGFLFYLIISNYLFMVLICAYCPHYGSKTALCGYGLLTKYLTQHKPPREFKVQFKRFIIVLFPDWFAPLFVGIYLLINEFNWLILILLIVFVIDAFGVVLYVSRSQSCKTCKLKGQCPWSSICGN
jgi:hypothetical protein